MSSWSEWLKERQAAREERQKARAAKREAAEKETNLREDAEAFVENFTESLRQERVDINEKQFYYFPNDLAAGAKSGYPFIRFGIRNNEGENKVAIFLYQPPGLTVSDGVNYSGFDIGTLKGGLGAAMGA